MTVTQTQIQWTTLSSWKAYGTESASWLEMTHEESPNYWGIRELLRDDTFSTTA